MNALGMPEFLNVDLDLEGRIRFEELVMALGSKLLVLNREGNRVTFELPVQPKTPETAIRHYSRVIESLPRELQAAWRRCRTRRFDVGVRVGSSPQSAMIQVSNVAIASLARLGADLAFTVYVPVLDSGVRQSRGNRQKPSR